MKVLKSWYSTNGRWGVEIVGEELGEDEHWQNCMPGTLIPLGERGSVKAFKYVPGNESFVVSLPDGEAVSENGAVEVCNQYLQSNNSITLFNAKEGAIFQSWGYKRRSSTFYAVTKEGLKEVPPSVLLALGLIEPSEEIQPLPEPKQPNNQMLEALKKAGLIK